MSGQCRQIHSPATNVQRKGKPAFDRVASGQIFPRKVRSSAPTLLSSSLAVSGHSGLMNLSLSNCEVRASSGPVFTL